MDRDTAIATIDNNAYLLTCRCPSCSNTLDRGYKEEMQYCKYCGQKLRFPAFSDEEVRKAHFESEMDGYES